MTLIIDNNLLEYIPLDIQTALSKMSEDNQKMKTTVPMVLLAIFFPIQLFF